MKNSIKILFTTAIILALSLFVYSCIKDSGVKTQEIKEKVTIEQLKAKIIAKGYQITASDRNIAMMGCMPSPTIGGDCITFHVSRTMAVPAYGGNPACDNVQVDFDVLWCVDADGNGSSSMSNFNAIPLNGNCTALTDYWFSLNNQNLEIAFDRFFFRASLDAEIELVREFAQTINAICPTTAIQCTFSTDLCFQWCIKKKPWSFQRNLCGRRCCIRTRTVCLNADGTLDVSAPEYREAGDTCKDDPIMNECNGAKTSCSRTCGPK